jgi:hypothetical protein
MRKTTSSEVLNKEAIISPLTGLMLIPMSWSRLDCYDWCNRQYKFRYIENREQGWTMPLALGNAVHSALESAIKYRAENDQQVTGWYLGALDEFDPSHMLTNEEITSGKDQAISTYRIIHNLVPDPKNLIDVEWGFRYIIGAGLFTGYVDLLFWDEDEQGRYLHLIDFKTGDNYKEDKNTGVLSKKKHTKSHGQTKLYTIAAKQAYPGERVKASLYWTKHKELDTHEYTDKELEKFLAVVKEKVADIIEDEKWDCTRAEVKCGYCNFATDGSCAWGKKAVERFNKYRKK